MDILRRTAHTLLAAPFVIDGILVIKDPDEHAKQTKEAWSTFTAWGAPELSHDQLRLASRIGGVVFAGLGINYAIGANRRATAAVLAAATVPLAMINAPVWNAKHKKERKIDAKRLMNYGVLAGGLILGALDRDGKPSRKWKRKQAQIKAGASK